jgi:hypothetical protein
VTLIGAAVCAGAIGLAQSLPPVPAGGVLAGDRPRVLVSTDLGGDDEDDMQSLVHLLLYADVVDVEGVVSSPPGAGRASHILRLLDTYARDHPALLRHDARYPDPARLRAVTKQGAIDPAPAGGWSAPTEGSRWIVERARVGGVRPLYVLAWGALTDVAQAVHDAPDIKARIRVYFVGSWNRQQDPAAFAYLDAHHRDLWFIHAETTFRGWYMGGMQEGDLGNVGFVRAHACGRGALGTLFCGLSPALGPDAAGRIKMGDTPSLAYLLRGRPDDPTSEHWGGRFVRHPDGRPRWWVDDPDPAWRVADRPGARTVSQYREQFLRDWQQRFARLPREPG